MPPSARCAASPSGASHGCSPVPTAAARGPAIYTLTATAGPNDVDPKAWLADVLARIADQPQQRLDELLPWNWEKYRVADPLAA